MSCTRGSAGLSGPFLAEQGLRRAMKHDGMQAVMLFLRYWLHLRMDAMQCSHIFQFSSHVC